jgi:signal transduction histidine kinase
MSVIEGVPWRRSRDIVFERVLLLPGPAVGIGYLAGYVLLDWVSYIHPFTSVGITPWNPGTGLSFAVVILFGRRMVPYLFVSPLLADLVNLQMPLPWGVELLTAAVIGGGYATASTFLLRSAVRFDRALPSLRDLLLLMLVATIGAGLVATAYVGVVAAAGLLPPEDLAAAALRYWVGDLIGIVVITPFALVVLTRRGVFRRSLEIVLQIAAIACALALVFGLAQERQFQLFYVLFLPIVWMAVRSGLEGVTLGILITQLGIILGVEWFREQSRDLMAYQVLMLILAVTGLVAGELVTERRRSESQLRLHRESLAKLGRVGNLGELATAIAHEINQPLAAAGTYARLVSDSLREGDADPLVIAQTAEKTAEQVERAGEVVRRLRALIRLDRSGRAPCNVEKIVKQAVALCQPALDRSQVVVHWNAAAKLPLVMVDTLQIEQVLLNLLRNSIEAVAEDKRCDGVINIRAATHDGEWVELQVIDNGPGFPSDSIDPFLPFTSQKPEGLGIGLRLCRSIVEAHGGRLWLNRGARGAEVHFTLPIAKELRHA